MAFIKSGSSSLTSMPEIIWLHHLSGCASSWSGWAKRWPLSGHSALEASLTPGFASNRAFFIEQLTKDTGFIPRISFDEGLRRTMEWIQQKGVGIMREPCTGFLHSPARSRRRSCTCRRAETPAKDEGSPLPGQRNGSGHGQPRRGHAARLSGADGAALQKMSRAVMGGPS